MVRARGGIAVVTMLGALAGRTRLIRHLEPEVPLVGCLEIQPASTDARSNGVEVGTGDGRGIRSRRRLIRRRVKRMSDRSAAKTLPSIDNTTSGAPGRAPFGHATGGDLQRRENGDPAAPVASIAP